MDWTRHLLCCETDGQLLFNQTIRTRNSGQRSFRTRLDTTKDMPVAFWSSLKKGAVDKGENLSCEPRIIQKRAKKEQKSKHELTQELLPPLELLLCTIDRWISNKHSRHNSEDILIKGDGIPGDVDFISSAYFSNSARRLGSMMHPLRMENLRRSQASQNGKQPQCGSMFVSSEGWSP